MLINPSDTLEVPEFGHRLAAQSAIANRNKAEAEHSNVNEGLLTDQAIVQFSVKGESSVIPYKVSYLALRNFDRIHSR